MTGPVIEVHLWSGLRRLAEDQTVVAVQATTLREMLAALAARHPALSPVLQGGAGISVSVNGEIVTNLSSPVSPGDEVYLLQRIKGG